MKKIAVIGGGITGLTAAFQLEQAGFHALVFEAQAQTGGAVRTEEAEGYQVESGPNSLQENVPEIGELVRSLGLESAVVEASPAAKNRYILRDGALVPLPSSPPALIRSKALSWRGKLRLLKEPFVGRPPEGVEENLAQFARRRLGQEVLDYLVNPFVAGIYAGDPERLSVKYALPRLFELEKEHGSLFRGMKAAAKSKKGKSIPRLISFQKGLATLPEELADRLRKQIYLETTVETITPREGKWEVVASRYGRRLRDVFDAVILALPPHALSRLGFKTETDEDDPALQVLSEVTHPPVASVSLGFRREQIKHPLDGFGVLFPEKEQRKTLGTLFPSTLFPGRAPEGRVLLTSFIGGMRQPEMAEQAAEDGGRTVVEDLRPLLGITGEPEFVRSYFWRHAIPQYDVGYGRFHAAIDSFESTRKGLFIAGSSRDGISLGQCLASGFRHAKRAIDYLS